MGALLEPEECVGYSVEELMRASLFSALAVCATLVGCDVYDSSLLGSSGGASSTGTSSGGNGAGGGEGGGATACETPDDCEGSDNECGTRTCEAGLCGVNAAPAGTLANQQTAADCSKNVCDGSGSITTEADDDDVDDDFQDCTVDSCAAGTPQHEPKAPGTTCTGAAGAQVCNALGACVQCVDGGDCPLSGLCTDTFTCAAPTCTDNMLSPGETDIDCGGTSCPGCPIGDDCNVNTDCLSMACSGTCQESCVDGLLNQDESDVDCGGVCDPCDVGEDCVVAADCASGVCGGSDTCGEYQLLISEARPRGPGAGTDDFIEIYNPLNVPVTIPADLELATRSDSAGSYSVKWNAMADGGAGLTLPARGHFLVAGSGYTGAAMPNFLDSAGLVTDKASIVLRRGATVLDALCFYCGTNPFVSGYTCEGTPISFSGCSSNNTDRSLERLPGGSAGNATDSGDNTADFQISTPANPQNLASSPTP